MTKSMADSLAAWNAVEAAINGVRADVDVAFDGMWEKIQDWMGDLTRAEAQRCVGWVRTRLPSDDVIAGIESLEEPPACPAGAWRGTP